MDKTKSAQSASKNNEITRRQRQFLPILLATKNITTACKAFDLDRKTFYSWMKKPAFVSALEQLQAEQIGEAVASIKMHTETAAAKLIALLESKDESIQLRASTSLLDFYLKAIEARELDARLAALEAGQDQK